MEPCDGTACAESLCGQCARAPSTIVASHDSWALSEETAAALLGGRKLCASCSGVNKCAKCGRCYLNDDKDMHGTTCPEDPCGGCSKPLKQEPTLEFVTRESGIVGVDAKEGYEDSWDFSLPTPWCDWCRLPICSRPGCGYEYWHVDESVEAGTLPKSVCVSCSRDCRQCGYRFPSAIMVVCPTCQVPHICPLCSPKTTACFDCPRRLSRE